MLLSLLFIFINIPFSKGGWGRLRTTSAESYRSPIETGRIRILITRALPVGISTNINRHYEEEQFSDVVISTDIHHSNQPRLVSVARLSME